MSETSSVEVDLDALSGSLEPLPCRPGRRRRASGDDGLRLRPGQQPGAPAGGLVGCDQPVGGGRRCQASPGVVPRPAHTVVVVMENHSYGEIIGNPAAPFINQLARNGALFTRSFAVTHPSQPNYLALFSGSTQGVPDDSCPHTFAAPNLAAGLAGAGMSFAGYAEDLPAAGSPACSQGQYARKHAPWTDFSNVPGSASKPFTSWPAGDFARVADRVVRDPEPVRRHARLRRCRGRCLAARPPQRVRALGDERMTAC